MIVTKASIKQLKVCFLLMAVVWTAVITLILLKIHSLQELFIHSTEANIDLPLNGMFLIIIALWLLVCMGLFIAYRAIFKLRGHNSLAEHGAQEDNLRYKRLTNMAFEGLVIHNKGIAIDANECLAELLKCNVDDIIGANIVEEFVHEEDRTEVLKNIRNSYSGAYEVKMLRKDGTFFYAELKAKIENYNGTEYRVTSVKDISKRKLIIDDLNQANQKLALHINNTPLAVLEWDLDFKISRWNDAAEMVFGYSIDEAMGKHASLILTEEAKPIADDIFIKLMQQTGGERSTNDNLRKDGVIITCEWYNTPLIDDNGNVIGVASLVQDITERVKTERQLLEKNHELESAEEELRSANEQLVVANDELKFKMHELQTAEEEIRATNEELVTTNDALKHNMHELEAAEEEVRASLEELQLKNTELLSKEKELQYSNKMLQLVIDHIPQRVFWKDVNSRYLGCNTNFAKDVGYETTQAAIGKTDTDLYESYLAQQYRMFDFEVINTGVAKLNQEETEGLRGEEERVFKTNRVPIKNDEGKVIGVLGTYENITNQKKIQNELVAAKIKAEESDRLKSSFLANMSHEIRTPMNGIIGFSQLLALKTQNDEKTQEFVDIIVSSGEQLLSIVDDVLNISKIETGQLQLNESKVNVVSLLNTMYPVFELKALNKNNSLKLNVKLNNNEALIETDATKLRQVIGNLLTNATKFTSDGEIELGCYVKEEQMYFFVKDNGIGISQEQSEKIFDRFLQVGKNVQDNEGGVGLGLSICKGLVNLMGGKIWVESEENVGSTFCFTIPLNNKTKNKENKNNDLTNIEMNKYDFSDKIILVAEDDLINHKVIEHMLADTQLTIIKAYNGKEAIEKFSESEKIDLVLMDIKMPVLNGFDAALELKSKAPNVPIIAQTAFALDENKEEFLDARFDNYLTKPLNREILIEAIYTGIKNAVENTVA